MTDEWYLDELRKQLLEIVEALTPSNIERCKHALRCIALGMMPESQIRQIALCVLEDR